jgi:hypothetical protein
MPNLKPCTILNGDEEIDNSTKEVVYGSELIPYSAMNTLNQTNHLSDFAHKCSTSGAHPSTFSSPTGSDSFAGQYGLYRMMKEVFDLDESSKICDLTGGRGDFQYVCRELNLRADTFSRKDTFSQVFYHPNVDFTREYDLRDNESLKFITEYDVVHVDVSFTGQDRINILDLILLLETNNITYTIRINSVSLLGYEGSALELLPMYDHSICYSSNSTMKPYQIYLLGTPSTGMKLLEGPKMKSTIAFRSIALGYARLLTPRYYGQRMTTDESNSSSIYLKYGNDPEQMIIDIALKSLYDERIYYLKRYSTEMEEDDNLYWVDGRIKEEERKFLAEIPNNNHYKMGPVYLGSDETSIGKVSDRSKPFHLLHLNDLTKNAMRKRFTPYYSAENHTLEYMRIHHPLQSERTKCNIILGMRLFNSGQLQSGMNDVIRELSILEQRSGKRPSIHQKEMQNAIKLLLIAANRNDYTYGIRYCHQMITTSETGQQIYVRTLRCYRLMSYHFSTCKQLIFHGRITNGMMKSFEHELEIREIRKIKYRANKEIPVREYFESEDVDKLIESSMKDLFTTLETWASSKAETLISDYGTIDIDIEEGSVEMNFDLDINGQIDRMMARLGLTEPNIHGFYDIGDDPGEDDDNW